MDEATGFDPGDPGFVRDPYPVFDRLRGQGRALWHEPMGMYLAFRHADADAVLRSRRLGRLFTPSEPTDVWGTFNWLHADSILDSEPPKHTRLRALVAKAFAPGHVERLRPRVRQLANALLDEVERATAVGSTSSPTTRSRSRSWSSPSCSASRSTNRRRCAPGRRTS